MSFLRRVDSGFIVHASTLEDAERDDLRRGVVGSRTDSVIQIGGHPHAIYAEPIGDDVLVVLERPLAEALQPYNRLVIILFAGGGAGLLLVLAGALRQPCPS